MPKGKLIREISGQDLAYIAGFIDGEGSFGITANRLMKHRKGYLREVQFSIFATVSSTDHPILVWLQETTGLGHVRKCYDAQGPRSAVWKWQCSSREAAQLAAVLLPLLRIKGPAASNIILFQSHQRPAGGPALTDAEYQQRVEMYHNAKAINRAKTGPVV